MDEGLMTIGEIAAFYHVSVKAIRVYEKKGIIVPAKINPSTGYRYYTADQVHTLNALLELKSLGFSLSEIKTIIAGELDQEELVAVLTRKSLAWEAAIAAAENKIDALSKISERISNSPNASNLQNLTDDQRAWLLAKMVCVEDLHGQHVLSEAIWL